MGEGDFPKSDGNVLYASEVNKFSESHGQLMAINGMIAEGESKATIETSGDNVVGNIAYLDDNNYSKFEEISSGARLVIEKYSPTNSYHVQGLIKYDDFGDNTISAALWDVTNPTYVHETNGYLNLGGTGSWHSQTVSVKSDTDFDDSTNDFKFYFRITAWGGSDGHEVHIRIKLNGIEIYHEGVSDGSLKDYEFRLDIDTSAQEAQLYKNGSPSGGAIDISSLNHVVKIVFHAVSGNAVGPGSYVRVYELHYLKANSNGTSYFISKSLATTSSNIKEITVHRFKSDTTGGAIISSVSANGGSNWEAAIDGRKTGVANQGTDLRVMIGLPYTSNFVFSTIDKPYALHWTV